MRAWTWKTVAKLTALICGILLLGYLFLTPMGALRLAVLWGGHPIVAATMQVREAVPEDAFLKWFDNPPNTTIYHIEDPVPVSRLTLVPMENWIVTEVGPFYWADYYGYC